MDSLQFDFIQTSMRRLRKESLIILSAPRLVGCGCGLIWDQGSQDLKINAVEELLAQRNQLFALMSSDKGG